MLPRHTCSAIEFARCRYRYSQKPWNQNCTRNSMQSYHSRSAIPLARCHYRYSQKPQKQNSTVIILKPFTARTERDVGNPRLRLVTNCFSGPTTNPGTKFSILLLSSSSRGSTASTIFQRRTTSQVECFKPEPNRPINAGDTSLQN